MARSPPAVQPLTYPTLGDPTWNDGDAGLGLGIGGPALLAVLAVAVGVFMSLARRFRLPLRRWVFGGVAGSLLLAAAALCGWRSDRPDQNATRLNRP